MKATVGELSEMKMDRGRVRPWWVRATAVVLIYVMPATSLASTVEVPTSRVVPQAQTFEAGWTSLPDSAETAIGRDPRQPISPLPSAATGLAPAALPELGPMSPATAPTGGGTLQLFGPQKYVRTTGSKNEYTSTVDVPAWLVSPYKLHVQNGEANGTYRVSSAWIGINGKHAVAAPSDFNQNVFTLDRAVTLTPKTTLNVTLASKPTSYLYLGLSGTSADHTAPTISVVQPPNAASINTAAPRLLVQYADLVGSDEPAASGVDTSTLVVKLDDVDRTALFTRRSSDASADLAGTLALAEGVHTLTATISDRAGNQGTTTSQFRVDLTPPTVSVVQPAAGDYLATTTPMLRVAYGDDIALDLATLRVLVNGVDQTSRFARGPAMATATLTDPLPQGPNRVQVSVSDVAGNAASASTAFNVDTTAPSIAIGQPAAGSRLGSSQAFAVIDYADDQALDLSTFTATLDGTPVTLQQGPQGANGVLGPMTEGNHTLVVSIRDKAGNLRSTQSQFRVDTTAPTVSIVLPPATALLATSTPNVLVTYADEDGVDPAGLVVKVDGNDVTSQFQVDSGSAQSQLSALPDGEHTIDATVPDLTGNPGAARSTFTVDTVAPAGEVATPRGVVGSATPAMSVRWSDPGTGIDVASALVFVDGVLQSGGFAGGPDGITGSPQAELGDGSHTLQVTVKDRAGNVGTIPATPASFVVDTTAPTVGVVAPAADSFINTKRPPLRVVFDGTGSAVVPASIRVTLQGPPVSGADAPVVDVTSWFAVSATGAMGVVPEAAELVDGTWRLSVQVVDEGGNAAEVEAAFEVDTVAPTMYIEAPASGGYANTATPAVVIRYQDDRSGIDTGRTTLAVDGNDASTSLTEVDGSHAAGALAALGEGLHNIEGRVWDRAGNAAQVVRQGFTVDTIAPVVTVATPAEGSWFTTAPAQVRFDYDGTGTAVDPGSAVVTLGTGPVTSLFTFAADHATGGLTTLPDGPYPLSITVFDLAGNPGTGAVNFTVDSQPPSIRVTCPSAPVREASLPLSGDLTDLDHTTAVMCGFVPAQVANGRWTCTVPLTEGPNELEIIATDRVGNRAAKQCSATLDSIPPALEIMVPTDGSWTNQTFTTVAGTVTDATLVTVTVQGVPAMVTGQGFSANGVPLTGDNPSIEAIATDAAGNTTSKTVRLNVTTTAPVVEITQPTDGAYLGTSTIDVTGTVTSVAPMGMTYVNDMPVTVTNGTFTATVPAAEGVTTIVAVAHDVAGNTGRDEVAVHVDTVPPVIAITAPATGTITKATSVLVTGTVTDGSPLRSVTVGGVVTTLSGTTFSREVPLGAEGTATIEVRATDVADNVATESIQVVVDRTPPALDIAAPSQGDAVGSVPVSLTGTVLDPHLTGVTVDGSEATVSGQAWHVAVGSVQGARTFTAVATDAAGNVSTAAVSVFVDLVAPTVTIVTPAAGLLTKATSVPVTGTVTSATLDSLTVTVSPGGSSVTVTPDASGVWSVTAALDVESDNTITATAISRTGRTGDASVIVGRDTTSPLVSITGPATLSRTQTGTATATVIDQHGVSSVVIKLDATVLATLTASPYTVEFTVPSTAKGGDTLVLSAEATDTAGNVGSATPFGVKVISDGIIVGQVIADTTGLPLPGATVEIAGAPQAVTATTGEDGRYRIPTEAPQAVLLITKDGMTAVERVISVASGVGTVPVDARLVKVSGAVTVSDTGGVVHVPVPEGAPPIDAVTVEVGPGAPGAYRLTLLSAQGLPGLLPLGYSPLAAWDIRSDVSSPSLTATVKGLAASGSVHLVQYRPSIHAWTMAAPDLQPTAEGTLTVELPALGTFALAVVDADAIVSMAEVGQTLNEAPYVAIPVNATSTGSAIPASLPPTGGTAIGSVLVSSGTPLPSGTVVQARVRQRFTKTSGEPGSVEELVEDVVLFREPAPEGAALAARIPITPALTFSPSEIKEGVLEIEILAGRESVRGVTGGSQAATVEVDGARLSVPAGSLPEDTVIAISPNDIWGLPTATGLTPLAQVDVTFAGQTLLSSAELSVEAPGDVAPGDSLLVVELVRVDGIQKVAVVALAKLVSGRIVSEPYPGLPGIVEGGEYVFYRTAAPVGFVSGITSSTAGPVRSVVSSDTLPFIGHSRTSGTYVVAAAPGSSTLSAAVPGTNLAGSVAGVPAEALQTTADVAIALTGTVTQATVTPSNGSTGVATGTAVQITTTTALKASTVTTDTIKLFKGNPEEAQSVALRFVLSASGQTLAAIPVAALEPGTTYTFQASGLADVFGGLISLEPSTFTTKPFVAPVFDTNAIVFSFPDSSGIVTVTVAPNDPPFLPPGTEILIINAGNGDVATFTVGNDGSVNGEIRASIDDRLLITVTAPDGSVTTYERSQYVNPETGETAVGPGGGTVTGPGGVELRIPEGATGKGVRFKIEGFTLEDLPEDQRQLPDLGTENDQPIAHFASGLKTTSPDMPTFKKEVDLVFPKPADAPEGSFFYVLRRIEVPDGEPMFAAIDIAQVEGDKVVTQSPPYASYTNSFGGFGLDGSIVGSLVVSHFLMWTYSPEAVNKPYVPGTITGLVQRLRPDGSVEASDPVVVFAKVNGRRLNTISWSAAGTGRFTFWNTEPMVDSVVELQATSTDGITRTVTAFDADYDDPSVSALRFYRRISTANITFPALEPPPPTPEIEITLLRLESDGRRVPITTGMVIAGTPLILRIRSTGATPVGADIQGRSCGLVIDPASGEGTVDLTTDACAPVLAGAYTINATAIAQPSGAVKRSSQSFLMVAAGGNNTTSLAGPPRVIAVSPRDLAAGVPVSVFPQITFSEPVRVGNNVTLTAGSGAVTVTMLGVSPGGNVVDVTANPEAPVTSVTVKPTGGLLYSTDYTLTVGAGLEDLDEIPSAMGSESITRFKTFGPEAVGSSDDNFGSPGIVVLEDRAYLVENNFRNGYLWAYDITDPVSPQKVGGRGVVTWRPVDIAGELNNEVVDERLVLVATGPTNESKPSNIYAFDVSDDAAPRWIGAASVTATAAEGFITRLTVKDGVAYSATHRQGIQIVDFRQSAFDVPYIGEFLDHRFVQAFNTDAQGKNREFVRTIPVTIPDEARGPQPAYLHDLKAVDLTFDGTSNRVVLVTGRFLGLLVLHATTEEVVYRGAPGGLIHGQALAFASLDDRPVAVLAGYGADGAKLVTVDLADPRQPMVLGSVLLPGIDTTITDIVLHNGLAIVGSGNAAVIVSVVDPREPVVTGRLAGVGGRLGLSASGLLLSTAREVFGGTGPLGGIHTATFAPLPAVLPMRAALGAFDTGSFDSIRLLAAVPLELRMYPADYPIDGAELLFKGPNDVVTATVPVSLAAGSGRYTIPAGTVLASTANVALKTSAAAAAFYSSDRRLRVGDIRLVLDFNNDTVIDQKDHDLWRSCKEGRSCSAFAFWEAGSRNGNDPAADLVDYATLRLEVLGEWDESEEVTLWMSGGDQTATWSLRPKDRPEKEYLRSADSAQAQVGREEWSSSGGRIQVKPLPIGVHEFLFRCVNCQGETLRIEHRGRLQVSSSRIDEVKVDIRPISQWMSVLTSHQAFPTGAPAPQFSPVPGWASMPPKAKRLTVLVHGSNVSPDSALGDEFPVLFKRLYWVGHEVLSAQGNDDRGAAHTIGLLWPGNERARIIPRFFSDGPLAIYSFNEYNAFQTGVPMGALMASWHSQGYSVNVMAHSMGNVAVNSAIRQATGKIADRYVMLEAAVPAEAFSVEPTSPNPALEQRARGELGYPDDAGWLTQWQYMQQGLTPQGEPYLNDSGRDYSDYEAWRRASDRLNPAIYPVPQYAVRWTAMRGGSSGWRGVFADSKGTKIFNTYYPQDKVVQLWADHQLLMKGRSGGRSGVGWALPGSDAVGHGPTSIAQTLSEERLWRVTDPTRSHINTVRHWAELAFWFPSLTSAVGVRPVGGAVLENRDMSAQASPSSWRESHSYFLVRPFPQVWKSYETFKQLLSN